MMLQVVFLETDRNWKTYRQISEETEQPVVHRTVMSEGEVVGNLVYCWKY